MLSAQSNVYMECIVGSFYHVGNSRWKWATLTTWLNGWGISFDQNKYDLIWYQNLQ